MPKLFLLCFCLILVFNCKSSQTKPEGDGLGKISLCSEIFKLEDNGTTINKLKAIDGLIFNNAYTAFHLPMDTIYKDKYRYDFAKNIKTLIASKFPDITIDSNNNLLKLTHSKMLELGYKIEKDPRAIEPFLITNSNTDKQLLIYTVSWKKNAEYRNTVILYVLSKSKKEILYKHPIRYYCDIRDETTLQKVIEYGLHNLMNNIQ